MRDSLQIFVAAALVIGAAPVHAPLGTAAAADEAAIRKMLDERNAAYNRHDAKAFAETYAADADLVTGTGRVVSGRAAIEKNYVDAFAAVGRNASVKIVRAQCGFWRLTRRFLTWMV